MVDTAPAAGGRGATDPTRGRLTAVCLTLPEATCQGEQHLIFQVRGRTFAYYLDDHHGDGRVAVCCKAPPGEAGALINADHERFYRPAYLGARGWISLDLGGVPVDWAEVAELVTDSYRLVAPRRLAAHATPTPPPPEP